MARFSPGADFRDPGSTFGSMPDGFAELFLPDEAPLYLLEEN